LVPLRLLPLDLEEQVAALLVEGQDPVEFVPDVLRIEAAPDPLCVRADELQVEHAPRFLPAAGQAGGSDRSGT